MKKKNQPTNKCGSIVLDVNAIGSTQWNFFDRHHTCVNIWPNKKKWTDIPLVQREKKKIDYERANESLKADPTNDG